MRIASSNTFIITMLALTLLLGYMIVNVSVSLKYECEDLDFLEVTGKATQVQLRHGRTHCDKLSTEKLLYQIGCTVSVVALAFGLGVRLRTSRRDNRRGPLPQA